MFGDLMGMMGKVKETQAKMEETKKRLDTVYIDEQVEGVKITVTANRAVKNIEIDESVMDDREDLEDLLVVALNKALDKAAKINEMELAAVAKEGMPDIPGLGGMGGMFGS